MVHFYKFSVIRLHSHSRDEQLNIGLAVFSEAGVDVRLGRRLERTRAISAGIDPATLHSLLESISGVDDKLLASGIKDSEQRRAFLGGLNPLSFSDFGTFEAQNTSVYEERIRSIIQYLVDPEPSRKLVRAKRSKLFSQVKTLLRKERVLASKDENLDSHRVVPSYELDTGLVADLVLKNGAMHVIETIDASGEEETVRKAIADIAVSALVLERARMKFGDDKTKARLVYEASSYMEKIARPALDAAEHQGAILTNWSSIDERGRFLHTISSLATPASKKKSNPRLQ